MITNRELIEHLAHEDPDSPAYIVVVSEHSEPQVVTVDDFVTKDHREELHEFIGYPIMEVTL